jgi:hypothetical protein
VREAKEAVLALSNQPAGNVTIGMTPGISDLLTTKLVGILQSGLPGHSAER